MSLSQVARKQIDSLSQYQIAYSRVGDNYEIPCQLPLGTLVITMSLPAAFPSAAPSFVVRPLVSHPSLDSAGRVLETRMPTWTMNTSLGRMVKDLLIEFTQRPPTPIDKSTAATQNLDPISLALDAMSLDDLKDLIADADECTDLVNTLPQVRDMQQVKADLLKANAKIAGANLFI